MACEFQSATHNTFRRSFSPCASLQPRFMNSSRGTTNDVWYTSPNNSCDSDNISDEIWYTPPQSFSVSLEILNREEVVPVKVMTPTTLVQISRNNIPYTKSIIPEEEAVCKFCFVMFPADHDENCTSTSSIVLKTNCGCPFTLTHRDCATEWSVGKGNTKCDVCDQDTHFTPVTLSRPRPLRTSKQKHNKKKGSALKRLMCCYSCGPED